jgi:microcystin degradation protein MlrC
VCVNRRAEDNPLGGGCGARGDDLHAALLGEIGRQRLYATVWLSRSYCVGACPRTGAAVALTPGGTVLTEALPTDAVEILRQARKAAG